MRRLVAAFCLFSFLSVPPVHAQNGPAGPPDPPELTPFSADLVEERARGLAARPFEAPAAVPSALLELTLGQWRALAFDTERTLWRDQPPGFGVRFFAPGAMYNRQVRLHVVEEGQSREFPFQPELFATQAVSPGLASALGQAGFAGFSLTWPLSAQYSEDEVASFLGASLFRAVGRNSQFGVQARGLALNTALPDGEEFPYFREFWLVKPLPDAQSMTVHALLDSPSLTGAYRFVVQPGTSTIMDVEAAIFPRRGAQRPLKMGIAPLGGMFLSSESLGALPGDYRPEAHSVDGLLLSSDQGWQWRPLRNGERLGVHAFPGAGLRGFGLLQRDGDFDHYQDIGARFERSASLWVETSGDWGPGHVELIEIPTKSDANNNVTAFWVSDAPDALPHTVPSTVPNTVSDAASAQSSGASAPAAPAASADGPDGMPAHASDNASGSAPDTMSASGSDASSGAGSDASSGARPDAGDGASSSAAQPLRLSYRLYWMTPGVTPHNLGTVSSTRIVQSPQDGTLRFLLDFEGAALSALPADTGLVSVLDLPPGVELLGKQLIKNPVTGGWRLSFQVRMPNNDGVVQTILSAREGGNSLRLRAALKKGENIPDPLTEMWVYDYIL